MAGPMNILKNRSIYYAAACFTILYVDITDCAPSPGILGKGERATPKMTVLDMKILEESSGIPVVKINERVLRKLLISNFTLKIPHHGNIKEYESDLNKI